MFRINYFGDPLPNPYYAKAGGATFLRLGNVVGGGWVYVLDCVRRSGVAFLLPALAFLRFDKLPNPLTAAIGILIGHLSFVIYAGGDWMSMWRFIAPIVPIVAVLVACSIDAMSARLGSQRASLVVSIAGAVLIGISTLTQQFAFLVNPTTPMSVVASIGKEFRSLAIRLSIEDPLLAHHDAGGVSFGSVIKLLDLGGLGDRALAKHMHDRKFTIRYLFEEKRPDFVFGSSETFSAGGTRFHLSDEFRTQYTRIEFPGKLYMKSDLCHVRRDRVKDVPGLEFVRVGTELSRIIVRPVGPN